MRQVQLAAYSYPERAYAKWLVLHLAWNRLSQDIGSGQAEQRFRYACEQSKDDVLRHLRNALDGTFRSALAFFRTKRGKGEEAKDVSTFFQLTKLNLQFTTFWRSAKNRHRKTVEDKIRKFKVALKNIEIPA